MVILSMMNMTAASVNNSESYEKDVFATNITGSTSEGQATPSDLRASKDVAIALMIGVTAIGNAFVLLCFVVDPKLRTPSNLFTLNLAICDFCIGSFSIPVYMQNYILNGKWILGSQTCKTWLVIDYALSQCSIYSVILISYDRFLAITKAVAYRDHQHNITRAALKIVAAWTLAFFGYGPVIISWEYTTDYKNITEGGCDQELFEDDYFRLWKSIYIAIFFVLPFVVILFFNVNICTNVGKRMKAKQKPWIAMEYNKRTDNTRICTIPPYLPNSHANKVTSEPDQRKRNVTASTPCHILKGILPSPPVHVTAVPEPPEENTLGTYTKKQTSSLSTDMRIAKYLSVLVGMFCLCWAPCFFVMAAGEICKQTCIPLEWSEAAYLFSYLNSSINPFIYPLCHPAFKKAFMDILSTLMCKFKFTRRKAGTQQKQNQSM